MRDEAAKNINNLSDIHIANPFPICKRIKSSSRPTKAKEPPHRPKPRPPHNREVASEETALRPCGFGCCGGPLVWPPYRQPAAPTCRTLR